MDMQMVLREGGVAGAREGEEGGMTSGRLPVGGEGMMTTMMMMG